MKGKKGVMTTHLSHNTMSIGSIKDSSNNCEERHSRNQEAQGVDEHDFQKTEDFEVGAEAKVRKEERAEGADLGQVRDYQVPAEHGERNQDH